MYVVIQSGIFDVLLVTCTVILIFDNKFVAYNYT